MINTSIKDSLVDQLDKIPYELQIRVLEFVRSLIPKGVAGKNLLKFEGVISADDLQLISKSIEENCEKIDTNEW